MRRRVEEGLRKADSEIWTVSLKRIFSLCGVGFDERRTSSGELRRESFISG